MAKKVKDLAVVTGTYTDGYGQEKRRYMNCGALMENDEGGQFIMLNRFINYADIPSKGGESILISVFDLRERDGGQAQSTGDQRQAAPADLDDDVPF